MSYTCEVFRLVLIMCYPLFKIFPPSHLLPFFLSLFDYICRAMILLPGQAGHMKVKSEVAQLRLTLCDPVDCSPPGFSVHGILQARMLEWVAISFSRGSSQPRDRTQVSHIAGRRCNLWATREVHRHVIIKRCSPDPPFLLPGAENLVQ